MVDTGIRPEGTLDDLLAQSDVIVDTTPSTSPPETCPATRRRE
jgi:phosphoglycerate dehydrogenase-like enzyme